MRERERERPFLEPEGQITRNIEIKVTALDG